jgi:membrane associated rhomboid family serine protease
METGEEDESSAGRLRRCFGWALAFVALLWVIHLAQSLLDLRLARYGVLPGAASGLKGVLFAPLIHGSFAHLFANTAPLLVLGTALLFGYPRAARLALPVIYLGSGLGVWLFARDAYHIGASGLTFGMMFFVFTIGVLRWDRRAIALSLIVFLLYGGMIWGIFPSAPDISFESHFFGALMGVGCAIALRNRDRPAVERHYPWNGGDHEEIPEQEFKRVLDREFFGISDDSEHSRDKPN